MTKTTRMAVLAAAAALAAGSASAAEGAKPSAEKFYGSKCATCHGKDGKGNAKMAAMFKIDAKELDLVDKEVSAKEDEEFTKAILDGKGKKMPAFKAKLDGLDVADLLKYVHGLKAAPAKAPAKAAGKS